MWMAETGQPRGRNHSANSLDGGDVIRGGGVIFLPKSLISFQCASIFNLCL